MTENKQITVDTSLYGSYADRKTAEANRVARSFGISEEALAKVEDYKAALTEHDAWDLPFLGYVNEDGYGYAFVSDQAVAKDGWDAYKAFRALPLDVQTAFAIRMLFTHRDVDRYGANMYLHYERGFNVKFEGPGANHW
ncbi:glycerophosphodiester phosphodiesterase [Bifidobacterium sp. 82T24]|uniref:glycerophosphodiester phosphodiesterase n=1 Tax=Bifidobacterium pluvialisilvae TaxID=2834436 RepID=UPI001C599D2B|nr:glycerophosphodiester phosphodiesterase [Bifidobacterium pluvialisilvae]MBW3087538.1 glycerophosphodiester phosphodiesterase [Bifidobacterium pluvialisilvae]